MSPSLPTNTLYYGDNLEILRGDHIPRESVDLVYLDPPFNSNRNYNVLFKDEHGKEAEAQIAAFEDTWHWNIDTQKIFDYLRTNAPERVSRMIDSLHTFIGANQMMAYLVMMTVRLVELHRVLKSTGSLYLHCDPTASHYLKIILDTIFSPQNFRNEIIWQRTSAHSDARRKFADVSDVIFFYTKSDRYTFNVQHIPHTEAYLARDYRFTDDQGRRYRRDNLASPNPRPNLIYDYKGYQPPAYGWRVSREKMEQLDAAGRLEFPRTPTGRILLRRYLDEMPGTVLGNVWTDIGPINVRAAERLGYPTQKPLSLLERIISASTSPGDIVLDPFCGCGTAVAAAQKLNRQWIGIDVTHLAIALQRYRMEQMFPGIQFSVVGEPEDVGAARQLAQDDRYQFQWWALSLIRARPLGGQEGSKIGKKGSDKGIDGVITFIDEPNGALKRVPVQVKSGHVKSGDIRDLRGTMEREQAAMGVFLSLEDPSHAMRTEAASAGFYHSPGWGKPYPKLQILTIAELLDGKTLQMPPSWGTFKQAPRTLIPGAEQLGLEM